jgi:hypothetical protein
MRQYVLFIEHDDDNGGNMRAVPVKPGEIYAVQDLDDSADGATLVTKDMLERSRAEDPDFDATNNVIDLWSVAF